MGIEAGAECNRVAVEAMIKARNEGVDYMKEGENILKKVAKSYPSLKAALDTWGELLCGFPHSNSYAAPANMRRRAQRSSVPAG